jgi:hypothetical protein
MHCLSDHLTCRRGGLCFFSKKNILIPNVTEKKYSDFGGGKKNNLIDKKINIRTLVLSEKRFPNKTENHTPPPAS